MDKAEFFMVAILCVMFWLFGFVIGTEEGYKEENKRIQACYSREDFSGFAWLGIDERFTCSADFKPVLLKYYKDNK